MSTTNFPSSVTNADGSQFIGKPKNRDFRTRYYELVELIIPAAGGVFNAKINFTDQSQLRAQADQQITIKAVETFTNEAIVRATSGNPVATATQLISAVLVLNLNSFDFENRIPLSTLNRVQGTAAPFVEKLFLFNDITKVIWPKCYVQFTDSVNNEAPFSYLFGIHYEIYPDQIASGK